MSWASHFYSQSGGENNADLELTRFVGRELKQSTAQMPCLQTGEVVSIIPKKQIEKRVHKG